jgi:Protein of unknown function (DUF3592)
LDGLMSARDDAWLTEMGVEVQATVIEVRRIVSRISRQPRCRVLYQYEYTVGWALAGTSRPLSEDAARKFKPGDRVLIKVDPGRPERSVFFLDRE